MDWTKLNDGLKNLKFGALEPLVSDSHSVFQCFSDSVIQRNSGIGSLNRENRRFGQAPTDGGMIGESGSGWQDRFCRIFSGKVEFNPFSEEEIPPENQPARNGTTDPEQKSPLQGF